MNFYDFLTEHAKITLPLTDKYGDWLGYQIEDFDTKARTLTTSLKIRQDHLSPSAAVHGGVVSGFLDFSCGCAVISILPPDKMCSTVDLNVKYFKPLKEGDEIIAKAYVEHYGKSLSTVSANVYRKGDEATKCALATATFNIYEFRA